MEGIKVAKEKIDMLLQLIDPINVEADDLLLNNKTEADNLTVFNHLDFDFLQVRTLIKEVEIGLNIL